MKVLLVKPYNLSDHIQPSLGLGYLATAIRKDHEVTILDCIKENIKPNQFIESLGKINPDLVGIQCYTFDLYNVKKMLNKCRQRNIKTVLGGPHPSTAPKEAMEFFGRDLDFLFHGEAECGFKLLIDQLNRRSDLDFKNIPGLVWRQEGNIVVNDKYLEDNLDSLGIPAWDLINPQTYPQSQHGAFFKNFPIAPIITTRGCPLSCTFCAGNLISGKKIRKRSVDNIINEIRILYDNYGIREFHIIDDNFTLDKKFAKNFLTNLKKLNLDISWAVPNGVRIDALDDEILKLMKQTGLYLISLGIESGSDRVLGLMKKGITTFQIENTIDMIKRHGIDIAGFFILGFPGETIDDINKTIAFSLKLDLIRANFFTYLPFPGTESYNVLRQQNKIDTIDLKRFYFMNATFTPEGIDKDELKSLQRKAFLKFFLRPRIFIYNLKQIKSFSHFKFLLKRFFRWMLLK